MAYLRLEQLREILGGGKPVEQQPVGHDMVRWVKFGVCPDCAATDQWIEGASGGMCINFRCDGCGGRFNVAMPPLNMIQRIG